MVVIIQLPPVYIYIQNFSDMTSLNSSTLQNSASSCSLLSKDEQFQLGQFLDAMVDTKLSDTTSPNDGMDSWVSASPTSFSETNYLDPHPIAISSDLEPSIAKNRTGNEGIDLLDQQWQQNSSPTINPLSQHFVPLNHVSLNENNAPPSNSIPSIQTKSRKKRKSRALLSEDIRKKNHIASEQKRRHNIRIGFDKLVTLVPGLAQLPRSESVILQRATKHIENLVERLSELKKRAEYLRSSLGLQIAPTYEEVQDLDAVSSSRIRTYRRIVFNNNKRQKSEIRQGNEEGCATFDTNSAKQPEEFARAEYIPAT
jgi:hypothetical protein